VLRWPHHPAVVSAAHKFADCGHAIDTRAADLLGAELSTSPTCVVSLVAALAL
jgi:hypothetical protein